MNLPAPDSAQRTRTLIETGLQEAHYLRRTDDRLFALPLSLDAISRLPENDELSEHIDAFVARFGRLQDTVSKGGRRVRLASESANMMHEQQQFPLPLAGAGGTNAPGEGLFDRRQITVLQ